MKKPNPTPPMSAAGVRIERFSRISSSQIAITMKMPPYSRWAMWRPPPPSCG